MLTLLAAALPAPAKADTIVEASIGWGDRFRPDRWSPAMVRAQADIPTAAILEWYIPRPGREAMLIRQSVTLNPQSGTFLAYLPLGPDPAAVHLTVSDARTGRTIAYWPTEPRSPIALADAQVRAPVFVGVSGDGPALRFLDSDEVAVAFLETESLPRAPIGYEGLDVLALNQPQIATMNRAQQHAIAAWVRGGGRLLIWLDTQSVPDDAPLTALLPARVDGFGTVEIGGEAVQYARLAGVPETQLLTRTPQGLGEVMFLHVSPEAAAAAGVQIIDAAPRPRTVAAPIAPQPAISAAEAASRPGRAGFGPLLAVALLIGPVDWLVLRRTRRRMRWWATAPGWILLIGVLTWYLPTATPQNNWAATTQETVGEHVASARATVATTGDALRESTSMPEVAAMHEIGRPYWRTLGFNRTGGPIRDVVFRQSDHGMAAGDGDSRPPAFVAEGIVYDDD